LASGEVIETGPLGKRELSRKMGLSSHEGQIYRSVDKLLEENHTLVDTLAKTSAGLPSSAGYNLSAVKHKDTFDLTPLFVGSEGTLGIISEVSLALAPYNPDVLLAMVSLENLANFQSALPKILD